MPRKKARHDAIERLLRTLIIFQLWMYAIRLSVLWINRLCDRLTPPSRCQRSAIGFERRATCEIRSKLFFHFCRTVRAAKIWWSRSGSNRRPQACKARALPTELRPRDFRLVQVVGPGRVERPTSRLSGVRSNHLSYEPVSETEFRRQGSEGRNVRSPERGRMSKQTEAREPHLILTSDSTEEGKRRRRQSPISEVQDAKIRRSWVACLLPVSKLGDRNGRRSSLIAVGP
jgi:hypothetical protein